ncbi:MAG: hypothetical protein DHS20C05_05790 [Hyphococcus sp.]|nr:MAG: hypothetical protein DHS20C05_05790 [Marinicaulis sp.]
MTQRTLLHDAVDLLRQNNRRDAVAAIRQYMAENTEPGERWQSVARLCDQIGEIDLSVEAMRRFAAAEPIKLSNWLKYCSELAKAGRYDECVAEIEKLPKEKRENDTAVLHLRSILATQRGEFDAAEPLIRKTIEQAPMTGQNWLSLAMIKKFKPGDEDLKQMEQLRDQFQSGPDDASKTNFYFALGKAYHDTKDYDRAFDAYSMGAEIRRREENYDGPARAAFTQKLISGYTPENFANLKPSNCDSTRPIFVTGLPRSGTTLLEQILTSHSEVSGGAELNLFRAALMPTGDFSYDGAIAYQSREFTAVDPWGDIGRDYLNLLNQRFGPEGRIVDKTLNHSRFMGLILHALPKAKVIWIRRHPDDTAISAFRNFFSSSIKWAWSLEDIGSYFKCDDALYHHWTAFFPDRILSVPYEELVADPHPWISKILAHVALPEEEGVFEPHKQQERSVMTASVAQVREPISPKQVGAAKAYEAHMASFRQAYYE